MKKTLSRSPDARIQKHMPEGAATLPLSIEIDEQSGTVRIQDARLFIGSKRGFCRRFLASISTHPETSRAEIELETSSCLVEFESAWATTHSMAEAVRQAIEQASAASESRVWSRWWPPEGAWTSLSFYCEQDEVSIWETRRNRPGHLRFRHHSRVGSRERLTRLKAELARIKPCESCQVVRWSSRLVVDCPHDGRNSRLMLDQIERLRSDVDLDLRYHSSKSPWLGHGPQVLINLAFAAGSFAMTLIGLIVPGIPTVPFLLATSYFLARSSPRLNDALLDSPFFGGILHEWEDFGGLSWSSKAKLVSLTGVILLATVILLPISPVLLVIMATMSSLSIYGIVRLPAMHAPPGPTRSDTLALTLQ